MTPPTRPVLRYHGGKWKLAPWLLQFFPPHRIYVEPYGGGGSVLMRKPRSYAEVYNDLDGEIVNVFQVLQDPKKAAALEKRLRLTPFARVEFFDAYVRRSRRGVEGARAAIIKSFMGFGSDALRDVIPRGFRTRASTQAFSLPTGFRANSNRSGTTPAHDWANYPIQVALFCQRLAGVVIERAPAINIIRTHDRAETLIYADPPYVQGTRRRMKKGVGRGGYRFEMSDDDHRELATVLRAASGMVVLSGYPSALYDVELYPDWERHERQHLADGARQRTEVVWLNPACARALHAQQLTLEVVNA